MKEGRDVVLHALWYVANMGEDMAREALAVWPEGREPLRKEALEAVFDPSKLAEMIAAEAQRCGFADDDALGHTSNEWRATAKITRLCAPDEIMIVLGRPNASFPEERPNYTKLPQARTVLAALIALPDGAKDEAEKILRGEHG
jgi:hypothetical protein